MSFLTKLPKDRYSSDGFAGFVGQREFNLGDGKAFAWMSQLAYETDEPEKIKDSLHVWGMTPLGNGLLAAEVNGLCQLQAPVLLLWWGGERQLSHLPARIRWCWRAAWKSMSRGWQTP